LQLTDQLWFTKLVSNGSTCTQRDGFKMKINLKKDRHCDTNFAVYTLALTKTTTTVSLNVLSVQRFLRDENDVGMFKYDFKNNIGIPFKPYVYTLMFPKLLLRSIS
jgi:hypothetical protein